MSEFYVKPGDSVTFAKTVGETDIYLFAGITGDFAANHVNEQYMAGSRYGRRIAHGALLIGFASTCSTLMIDKCQGHARDETPGRRITAYPSSRRAVSSTKTPSGCSGRSGRRTTSKPASSSARSYSSC